MKYARRRISLLGRASARGDDYYARELAQNALGDTFRGLVSWDPATRSLFDHVCGVVWSRSTHDAEHAAQFPHESLDDPDLGGAFAEQVDHALRERAPDMAPERAMAERQRWIELRAAAAAYPNAVAILDAVDAEALSKKDVLAHAKLTNKEYRAGCAQLTRISKELAHASKQTKRRKRGA